MVNNIKSLVSSVILLFCVGITQTVYAETVSFGRTGQVSITPPRGWQVESYENVLGIGTHDITLIADESRKPGCTIFIYAGDRQPAHTEASFLTFAENFYERNANEFVEKIPNFLNLNVNNGIGYYFVANYAEYYGKPPAEGRANVCGMVFLYRENIPLIVASLYVDDPKAPALDLMVKAITEMEIVFPDYQGNMVQFDNSFAIKIDIPTGWRAARERGTPVPHLGKTYDLAVQPPPGEKALLRITIGRPENEIPLTRQQFESLVSSRVNLLLPNAVEREAEYKELPIHAGYSKYCILTDKSLVNKTPKEGEYTYVAVYFANYDNGNFVYATILTDDPYSAKFQLILNTLSSME